MKMNVLGIQAVYCNHWRINCPDGMMVSTAVVQIKSSNLMPEEIIYNSYFPLLFVRFQPAITAAQLNEVVGCGYENILQISALTFSDWIKRGEDTIPKRMTLGNYDESLIENAFRRESEWHIWCRLPTQETDTPCHQ